MTFFGTAKMGPISRVIDQIFRPGQKMLDRQFHSILAPKRLKDDITLSTEDQSVTGETIDLEKRNNLMIPIIQHGPSTEDKEGEEHLLLSPQKSDEDSDNGVTLSPVSTVVSGLTLEKSLEYYLDNDFDDESTEVSSSDKDYGPSDASSSQQMMTPPSLITLSPMSSEISCITLARCLDYHLDSDFDDDESTKASSSSKGTSAVVSTNSPSEALSSQLSKAIPPLNNLALQESSKKTESPCFKPLGILKTSTITNTRESNNHELTFSNAGNDNKKGEPLITNIPPKKKKISSSPLYSPVKPRQTTVKFATHKKRKTYRIYPSEKQAKLDNWRIIEKLAKSEKEEIHSRLYKQSTQLSRGRVVDANDRLNVQHQQKQSKAKQRLYRKAWRY